MSNENTGLLRFVVSQRDLETEETSQMSAGYNVQYNLKEIKPSLFLRKPPKTKNL